MNVIIKNPKNKKLDKINMEVIKTLSGQFTINQVQEQLVNLYYNKVVIDVTAINNFLDINTVLIFLKGFDPMNVVLLLTKKKEVKSNIYLKRLIEIGVYNFTYDAEKVIYLLNNPNTLEDVQKYNKEKKGIFKWFSK